MNKRLDNIMGQGNYIFALSAKKSIAACLNVVVIDRRRLFRDCLGHLINKSIPDARIGFFDTAQQVRNASLTPDLIAIGMDEVTPQRLDEELRVLVDCFPDTSIVAIADNENDLDGTLRLTNFDLAGVALGDCSTEILAAGLLIVSMGGSFAPANICLTNDSSDVLKLLPDKSRDAARNNSLSYDVSGTKISLVFTKREMDIIDHLHKGSQNKIIAYDLNISESTVKVHLRNIMKKLNVTNRTQVALYARTLKAESSRTGNSSHIRPPVRSLPLQTNANGAMNPILN